MAACLAACRRPLAVGRSPEAHQLDAALGVGRTQSGLRCPCTTGPVAPRWSGRAGGSAPTRRDVDRGGRVEGDPAREAQPQGVAERDAADVFDGDRDLARVVAVGARDDACGDSLRPAARRIHCESKRLRARRGGPRRPGSPRPGARESAGRTARNSIDVPSPPICSVSSKGPLSDACARHARGLHRLRCRLPAQSRGVVMFRRY